MSETKTSAPRSLLVRASDREGMLEESFRHPLNPNSELHGYDLGRRVGLTCTGVTLARVPARRESYAPHSHAAEEEWLFVLHGRGIVDIDDQSFDVSTGDFVGFPRGTFAHHVRNPNDEELVYLCGGERRDLDIVDYPAAGRRAVRIGHEVKVYPRRAGEPLFP